jgi:hypothetical protein
MRMNKLLNIRLVDPLHSSVRLFKKLPGMWGLSNINYCDFPHKFNNSENQDYVGKTLILNIMLSIKSPEDANTFENGTVSKNILQIGILRKNKSIVVDDVEILSKSVLA